MVALLHGELYALFVE